MQARKRSMATGGVACLAVLLGNAGRLWSQQVGAIQPADGLVCLIVNKNSGRCLSVAKESVEPGARIVQGPLPSKAGPSERWQFLASGEAFRLRNEHSGLVMQIWATNLQQGVQAVQSADQVNKPHQHWSLEPAGEGYVLRAGHSQLVLGAAQSSMEEGARVIQWNPIPNLPDQMWLLRSPKDAMDLDAGGAPAAALEEGSFLSRKWLILTVLSGVVIAILLAVAWAVTRDRGKHEPAA